MQASIGPNFSTIRRKTAVSRLRRGPSCDSGNPMSANNLTSLGRRRKVAARPHLPKRRFGRVAAVASLIFLGALMLVGPTGVRAWSESARMLDQREMELSALQAERDRIANRVELLDPAHADPDLVGELLRSNLNVAHQDELVLSRDD